MYIKRNHQNSIGMKIPLVYEDANNCTVKRIELDELISLCRSKKMFALKEWIP